MDSGKKVAPVNAPKEVIDQDLQAFLPPEEDAGIGLGGFPLQLRLSGVDAGLIRQLNATSSRFTKVLDGRLKSARQRGLSTRLSVLAYEAIVHTPEWPVWTIGYKSRRIPNYVPSNGLFRELPPRDEGEAEHINAWRTEESSPRANARGAHVATFTWMLNASKTNQRVMREVRVLRLFEQTARAEACAHFRNYCPSPAAEGQDYWPSADEVATFKARGKYSHRVDSEIVGCLHMVVKKQEDGLAWHATWNRGKRGAVLGSVLARRINRMWRRLEGPYLGASHGLRVDTRGQFDAMVRAADDPSPVRPSWERFGSRCGAVLASNLVDDTFLLSAINASPEMLDMLHTTEGIGDGQAVSADELRTYLGYARHTIQRHERQRDALSSTSAAAVTVVERSVPTCDECGTSRLEKNELKGELACMDCGLVIDWDVPDAASVPFESDDGKGTSRKLSPVEKKQKKLLKGKEPLFEQRWNKFRGAGYAWAELLPEESVTKHKREILNRIKEFQKMANQLKNEAMSIIADIDDPDGEDTHVAS